MIRILAISDIHGRIAAVENLRAAESNSFDAIVIAGDIGRDSADDIFSILLSFEAPILYVFGNHDIRYEYDRLFPGDSRHLHHDMVRIGEFSFLGYSGLQTGRWGRNPIALRLFSEADDRHRAAIDNLAELRQIEVARITEIELACAQAIRELDAKTRDRRHKLYRNKADKIYGRFSLDRDKARAESRSFQDSQAWREYQSDITRTSHEIERLNRLELARLVERADPDRCVVVTHERLSATDRDMPETRLFLFGHRHGFKSTYYRGSQFVNVSALDSLIDLMPAGSDKLEDVRTVDQGSYVVIELGRGGQLTVSPRRFMETPNGWVRPEWLPPGLRFPLLTESTLPNSANLIP